MMSTGYHGKILRVDLSDGRIWTEEHDDTFYRRYYGGKALIGYYLLKEMEPGTDPLGPENRLIFAPGVLTGTPASGSGRNAIGGKSPLTGGFACAEAGGYWGAELKQAGFDAIVVEGQAQEPVYLWIKDGQAELRDASHLWGRTTGEVEAAIQEELDDKKIRVCQIGPGGERLIRFACIANDLTHFAGRTGLGAVMGSKKLRAVAVRGSEPLPVADKEKMRQLARSVVQDNRDMIAGFQAEGTAGSVPYLNAIGGLPTRNFQRGDFEEADAISGEAMAETILVKPDTCFACGVRCKRVVAAEEPYHVDPLYGGPEYETIAALGSNCGVGDLVAVAKANELCAAYGIDTIATGLVIGFVNECFERGVLTAEDTGGLELGFGKAEAMLELVRMIIERRGIGDLLAEGVARTAEELGEETFGYALHVKGQEFPMHMPRLKQGMGVGYAVSPTGAEHETNMHDTDFSEEGDFIEGLRELGTFDLVPEWDLGPDKMRMLIYQSTWMRFLDCASLCHFVPWSHTQVTELVRATVGWDSNVWEMMKVGERAFALARAFNAREGIMAEADRLPERCFEPVPGGPLEGVAIDREAFGRAMRTFYRMSGLDEATGAPAPEKLGELGVYWVAEELAQHGVYQL